MKLHRLMVFGVIAVLVTLKVIDPKPRLTRYRDIEIRIDGVPYYPEDVCFRQLLPPTT